MDVMLSERRDLAATKAFLRSPRTVTGMVPDRVTSDGHHAYPAAIWSELGEEVRHRTNVYLNKITVGSRIDTDPCAGSRVSARWDDFVVRSMSSRVSCASDPSTARISLPIGGACVNSAARSPSSGSSKPRDFGSQPATLPVDTLQARDLTKPI